MAKPAEARHRTLTGAVGVALAMLAATLGMMLPVVAMAALPPINDPPTSEYRRGKFVWIDLVTADVAAARRFYGGLFGWVFADLGAGPRAYTLAYQAGVPVAGMFERQPAPNQVRQARWIAFLSVTDVAAASRLVTAKGGKTLIPPRAVDGRGEMAVVADPDGAPFGLINSSSGDPGDFLSEIGDWIWALYQSPDAQSATAFYQDLGGHEVVADARFDDTRHFLLLAGGFARAELVEIPAERSKMRPDWLYFVRVRDVGASVARAVELGGRVLVAPDPTVLEGRVAVIADPAGAPVGMMEWEETREEGD